MRKIRFETLVPDELLQAIAGRSLVYQPIGSLEWHGPHMGMGMDTNNAYAVAMKAAERTDGVVMPPLYIGTETQRSSETLKKLGFSGEENIVGMDFPQNSVKSFYWPPQIFEMIVREQSEMLLTMGFSQIVWLNGHGADMQIEILQRVCSELSQKTGKNLSTFMALTNGCGAELGHAGLAETAILSYLCPEAVELDRLPQKPEKIYNVQFGIADSETFTSGPNEDFSVRYDPRNATQSQGEHIVEYTVSQCVRFVNAQADTVVPSCEH